MIADKIERSGYKDRIGAGIVITGGMAKLDDVRDLAAIVFDNTSVRIARAKTVSGLHEIAEDIGNSCALGLCMYGFGEFTPYEMDSNGKLRYKDEIINKNPKRNISDYYEKEVSKAIEKDGSRADGGAAAKKDDLNIQLPKKDGTNFFNKIWSSMKNWF